MARISRFSFSLALSLLALSSTTLAQSPAPAQPQPSRPSDAPPKMEVIEEGSDKPITVAPRQGGTKITEKKVGGVVTEVKVKSGKSSYTLKPNTPAGNAHPGDGQSNALRGPQWTVLEFDLNKKKKAAKEAEPEKAAVPPPPAAAPAAK